MGDGLRGFKDAISGDPALGNLDAVAPQMPPESENLSSGLK